MKSEHNYLFVSDLHLSEGRDPVTGHLSRTEDFFYDEAFARFIVYHVHLGQAQAAAEAGRPTTAHYRKPWKLFLNGDLFDFLQVTQLPEPGDELFAIRGVRSREELSENERVYGLGTRSREIVWKLGQIAQGHPIFFQALGWFLAHSGNELIILKGNHDVELHWPAVQQEMCNLIAASYQDWFTAVSSGRRPDSPLPLSGNMPPELEPQTWQGVKFPRWFYYEPDLFYIEHGSQYDPANAFVDFLEPIMEDDRHLPHDEQRIELPSGSFFVRYFFNKVEQVHPFADNMKPITRYIRWATTKEPLETLRMLLNQRRKLWLSLKNLIAREADPFHGSRELEQKKAAPRRSEHADLPLNESYWQAMHKIRDHWQQKSRERGTQSAWNTAANAGLNVGMRLFLLQALRNFVQGRYGRMLGNLTMAILCFGKSNLVARELDQIEDYTALPEVAADICHLLNQPAGDTAVRYHIFGHNHHAAVRELNSQESAKQPFRQWYVNTGCWMPVFDDSERLFRDDVQLTFLRLVPSLPDFDHSVPQLLEWRLDSGRPRAVPILAPNE